MSVAKQFGDNLARLRRRSGLSQEEVGYRASVHRTEISQLERGLRIPRIDTVVKLAGALGIDPGELCEGIKWESGTVHAGRFELPDQDATL